MYKFRLYRNDNKDKSLRNKLFVASLIWNHFIALQRRYYKLTGKYIPLKDMNNRVLKLRRTKRDARWKELYSQACQNVCSRIDDGYQRFFNKFNKRSPKFRKAKKYRSFTFPQSGYKLEVLNRNEPLPNGKWKRARGTVRIDGKAYSSPEFFKQDLKAMRQRSKALSHKVEGSKRYKRARRELAKQHAHVAHKRRDFQFKLAHRLCGEYDILYFEDFNLDGMKRLWGRKVSDLGLKKFMTRLDWIALKRGKIVVKIDRFARTTQKCSGCERKHALTLRDRVLSCPRGLTIDRDHNAATNIKGAGASTHYRSDDKTRGNSRGRVEGRRPRL